MVLILGFSHQLCLLAKCFKPAVPFLELDMMDICKENGAYDAKHFLCYYYYGGMIYTGLKNFERALYFFEQVLSHGFQYHSHNKNDHGLIPYSFPFTL